MKFKIFFLVLLLSLIFNPRAGAAVEEFIITIKDHQFSPQELAIPAGQKVKLIIENQDATAEEFESYDLNREKVVAGNSQIIIFVGPLKPGTYEYFGEFHQATAQGVIVAVQPEDNH